MKRKLQIITTATAASFLTLTVLAQQTPDSKPVAVVPSYQPTNHLRTDRLNGAVKANELIGTEVQNNQHEKLGKVDDLAVDVQSGRIVAVILSTGGFLGLGTTLNAVPPGAVQYDAIGKVVQLDVSKDMFKAAPHYDAAKWDETSQSNQVVDVYGYYGEQPYFIAERDGYRTTNSDGTIASSLPRHMDGTINTDAGSTTEKTRNAEIARNFLSTNNLTSIRNPDGTWTRGSYPNDSGANASWSGLGYVENAGKLTGTSVRNLQDEKLGKVENLMLDLSAGRLVAVIISSGGFIGMGDELSAVPPAALRFNTAHDTLQLDASKEMLANSPHFKANAWPDLSQPGYVSGVYRAYKVAPYFATDAVIDADNTGRNVRDRNSGTLTPLDQGNSPADIATTASIRKGILADSSMSLNARNVKIITNNGQVTLRGPVSSAKEKGLIGDIADRIAHTGNVDNQLEVQLKTSSNN